MGAHGGCPMFLKECADGHHGNCALIPQPETLHEVPWAGEQRHRVASILCETAWVCNFFLKKTNFLSGRVDVHSVYLKRYFNINLERYCQCYSQSRRSHSFQALQSLIPKNAIAVNGTAGLYGLRRQDTSLGFVNSTV